jgi:hypothetical protein
MEGPRKTPKNIKRLRRNLLFLTADFTDLPALSSAALRAEGYAFRLSRSTRFTDRFFFHPCHPRNPRNPRNPRLFQILSAKEESNE